MPDPDIRPDQIQDLDTRPDQIPNTYVQDGSPTLGKANKGQTENGQNDAFWLKFRLGSDNFWAEYRGKDRLGVRGISPIFPLTHHDVGESRYKIINPETR